MIISRCFLIKLIQQKTKDIYFNKIKDKIFFILKLTKFSRKKKNSSAKDLNRTYNVHFGFSNACHDTYWGNKETNEILR